MLLFHSTGITIQEINCRAYDQLSGKLLDFFFLLELYFCLFIYLNIFVFCTEGKGEQADNESQVISIFGHLIFRNYSQHSHKYQPICIPPITFPDFSFSLAERERTHHGSQAGYSRGYSDLNLFQSHKLPKETWPPTRLFPSASPAYSFLLFFLSFLLGRSLFSLLIDLQFPLFSSRHNRPSIPQLFLQLPSKKQEGFLPSTEHMVLLLPPEG